MIKELVQILKIMQSLKFNCITAYYDFYGKVGTSVTSSFIIGTASG